jgi:hypothetical protein
MTPLMLTLFGIALLSAVAWNALYPRLLARLRRHHTPLWQQLGCPRYLDCRYQPAKAILRFLFRREYRSVSDPKLGRLAGWLRTLLLLLYCVAAALIVLFFASMWTRG